MAIGIEVAGGNGGMPAVAGEAMLIGWNFTKAAITEIG